MGCICSSRKEEYDFETKYFSTLETVLALPSINFSILVDIIDEHKSNRRISSAKIGSIFRKISINYLKNADFYGLFQENDVYDLQTLITLLLLFSRAQTRAKASLLFKIYASGSGNYLSRNEIFTMVNKIINLSCLLIPGYILSLNRGDTDFEKFVINIKKNSGGCAEVIVQEIVGVDKRVDKNRFIEKIEDDCYYLLNMKRVRKFCNELDSLKMDYIKYVNGLDLPEKKEFLDAIAATEEGELDN